MPEWVSNRPHGPLQEGDQAIIDALTQVPTKGGIYHTPNKSVVLDLVESRETTPGLPKDHWSVASVGTDADGNPVSTETTLITLSARDIDVVLRGNNVSGGELRTEEDKPKATERAKLHEKSDEQSIKILAARRISEAAKTLLDINRP